VEVTEKYKAEVEGAYKEAMQKCENIQILKSHKAEWKWLWMQGQELLRDINRKLGSKTDMVALYRLQGGLSWLARFIDLPKRIMEDGVKAQQQYDELQKKLK